MNKKIKYLLVITISLVILFSGVVFAYYIVNDDGQSIDASLNITEDSNYIVEVSSLSDLIKEGTDSKYNSSDLVSDSATRKTLKLTENITLTKNVILTKDIHLDLNGKTLNLNDYELIFKHGYSGCFVLYDGQDIETKTGTINRGASGKIIIDLPNAGYKIDSNIIFKTGETSSSEEDVIKVLNLDQKYTVYSALYLIANSFASDLDSRPEFKTYADVQAISSFTPDLFIDNKTCSLGEKEEACSFVYKDLALINNYLSTDIKISYSSSNENIINNYGELGETFGDVNLTITISKDGWNDTTCTFPLHVVDLSDDQTKQNVGFTLIKAYLKNYYISGNLVIKDQTVLEGYYYKFDHAIDLPKTALNGNIEFTYQTTNLDNEVLKDISKLNENTYTFIPTMSDYHLKVTVAEQSISLNMYSTYVGLEEIVAYHISNELYGGSIIYNKASDGKQLVTKENIRDSNLISYMETYGVSSISYALKAESTAIDYYQLNANFLKITSIPPDKVEYVTMTVKFGENESDPKVNIDLFIEYLDSEGTTLSSYITYYSEYNALVPSELETSFTLPFSTNNIAPFTCYDVATYTTSVETVNEGLPNEEKYTVITPTLYKPKNLTIELYYDNELKITFAYDAENPQSFTKQLDNYLQANNVTLDTIASKNGDNAAYYKFSINAQESLAENTKLVIIYNFKFDSAASWTRYENGGFLTDNNTTYLTVLGGLFFNTKGQTASGVSVDNAVMDPKFFIWIYNKFRPGIDGYNNISQATANIIIPIDWLGQSATITNDDIGLKDVTKFNGIKYLTGITEANLSGSTINENVLTAISEMKSIAKLNLSNCGLTNISYLSKLAKQGTLKVLDLSNNNIQYFETITNITSLEKVYLYGNNTTNKYYGSKGICNFQAFADLMRNGCSIYNDTSNGIAVLYSESNNLDDYRRLKEIAYQEILKDGKDITTLYTQFKALGTNITEYKNETRPGNNPFGLQTPGTLSWGYEGDNTSTEGVKYHSVEVVVGESFAANKYYELTDGNYNLITTAGTFEKDKTYYVQVTNTNATYFYVTLTYSPSSVGNYVLKVKYYVDRS